MVKTTGNRQTSLTDGLPQVQEGFTAAELCAALKTAHEDFVSGKTNRKAFEAVSRNLLAALAARRQMLAEKERFTAQRCNQYYN